jgi:hypothetical protein
MARKRFSKVSAESFFGRLQMSTTERSKADPPKVLGVKTAVTLLRRIEFHYTPKHASWLNMAEIEIGVLQRQCLARCAAEQATLATEVSAWQRRRNAAQCGIEWTFTRRDADRKLSRHYVS